MPTNVEIKARARDVARQSEIAAALSDRPAETIEQTDTFFVSPRGRLKLRELGPDRGELIYYARDDRPGPARSDYSIARTNEPDALRKTLAAALGVLGVVRKTRSVYHVGRTRIHIDDVEGLGRFLELEVALAPNESVSDGERIAREIMAKLGVRDEDLVERAYVDLLVGEGEAGHVH